MQRKWLTAVACILAAGAAGALAFYLSQRPDVVRVAVGPSGSENQRLVAAMTQLARERKAPVRFRPIIVDGPTASAAALEAGEADMAVVRSDIAMPTSGQTALILQQLAAVLVAPAGSGIRSAGDLSGRRIGIVQGQAANERLLDAVLQHYEITPGAVQRTRIQPADVAATFREQRVDAVMALGVTTSGVVADTVAAVTSAGNGAPVFIPVAEASAIAERAAGYHAYDVLRGAFGGNPPRPAEGFATLAVSHRLMARTDLDEGTVGEVVRFVLSERQALSQLAPIAARITAPETDKGQALPVHPGAAAYLDGEEMTFFDRYGDLIYIGAMVLSVLGSAGAALASRMARSAQGDADELMERLVAILRAARGAENGQMLDELERESDRLLASALSRTARPRLDSQRVTALGLMFDQIRMAIRDRRRVLAETSAAPVIALAAVKSAPE